MPFNPIDPALAVAAPVTTIGAPLVSTGETLATLQAEVIKRLGNRSDLDPARVVQGINDAYLDMATSLDLSETKGSLALPTHATKYLYFLPDVVWYIEQIVSEDMDNLIDGGSIEFELIDLNKYRKLAANNNGFGFLMVAHSYFQQGNILVLYPTPDIDGTVTVDFVILPKKLVNPTDSPILGREWHEGLKILSTEKTHRILQEPDLADPIFNDYIRFVQRRIDRVAEADTGRFAQAMPIRTRRQLARVRGQFSTPSRNPDLD